MFGMGHLRDRSRLRKQPLNSRIRFMLFMMHSGSDVINCATSILSPKEVALASSMISTR